MNLIGPNSYDTGNAPLVIADMDPRGQPLVSTAVTFTVTDPLGNVTVTSSPDAAITNPSTNVWTFQMTVLAVYGWYIIKCDSTAGLLSSRTGRLLCRAS